jgi:catechol 2,3-dioxygenase-like lactoylglutathione lyase family enzyme
MVAMMVQSVTVSLPVADLERSVAWYRRALQLENPDLEPAEGVVEFRVGAVWLQLAQGAGVTAGNGVTVRFGVPDVAAERARLRGQGIEVGELEQVENVLEYFDFLDPDGNRLSFYAETEP